MSNRRLSFVTGNPTKVEEASAVCSEYDIELVHTPLKNLKEIQGTNPLEIALEKAETAYRRIGAAIVINDSFWSIASLNGFPGAYLHDINTWFDAEDFVRLMEGKADRRLTLTDTVIMHDGKEPLVVKTITEGVVAKRASQLDGPASDNAFILDVRSGLTIAEARHEGAQAASGTLEMWRRLCRELVTLDTQP